MQNNFREAERTLVARRVSTQKNTLALWQSRTGVGQLVQPQAVKKEPIWLHIGQLSVEYNTKTYNWRQWQVWDNILVYPPLAAKNYWPTTLDINTVHDNLAKKWTSESERNPNPESEQKVNL